MEVARGRRVELRPHLGEVLAVCMRVAAMSEEGVENVGGRERVFELPLDKPGLHRRALRAHGLEVSTLYSNYSLI